MYAVKEIFSTLQGEGAHVGRAAVFCRFSGCNLWSGREADRTSAICSFCDTDFVGTDGKDGGRFPDASTLAQAIESAWQGGRSERFVVLTGGEPTLQLDFPLIEALHQRGFFIAMETNGTLPVLEGVDWICVSPKAGAPLRQLSGQELKLVHPQLGVDPSTFEGLSFERFALQPMAGPGEQAALAACIDYCLRHPRWKLSLQTHKMIGIR